MPSLEQIPFTKILVRMPNWIGDLVMGLPVLDGLRARDPQAEITAVCKQGHAGLLQKRLSVNKVVELPIEKKERKTLIKTLSVENYDLGVLLPNSFSSAWWLWKVGARYRLGYKKEGRSFLLTHSLAFSPQVKKRHLVETYKELLSVLGVSSSFTAPRLALSVEEKESLRERFGIPKAQRIVGINPGAAYGSAKCWLPERFQELTRILVKKGVLVLYFGDLLTAPLVQEICQGLGEDVRNLAGKTSLRELMGLIGLCTAFVTNDSGPMHIADALGVPLVALFGSTSPLVTGPYHKGKVIYKKPFCSPCYQRACPLDFRCMKEISVEEVYREVDALL